MATKMRFCWVCGVELGVIDDRHYHRSDTCGARECDREAREQDRVDRDEAHRQLDEDMGWR